MFGRLIIKCYCAVSDTRTFVGKKESIISSWISNTSTVPLAVSNTLPRNGQVSVVEAPYRTCATHPHPPGIPGEWPLTAVGQKPEEEYA